VLRYIIAMDPLTGLSLACNIMQVIQFSAETLAVFKRLSEGSSPDPYAETNSQSLVTSTKKLKYTLNTPSIINRIPRDAALFEVCNQIVQVADALHKRLQKSLPFKGESKAKTLRKSIAFQLKHKSATERLSQQLDRLRSRMESEILIDLRQTLKQDQSELVDRLQMLDNDLKSFCTNLIAGQTSLEGLLDRESGEIKKAIADEAQKTRDQNAHIAQETRDFINATQSERISDAAYQQFLHSFRFPGINARRNTIQISHPDTFEWIFEEPGETQSSDEFVPKWSSFPTWLHGGTGTYWISGKAGAGKSTLMKFLIENRKTKRLLSESRLDTMIICAFIWSLGTDMQKSVVGVLCTLLYDVFAQNRDICERQMRDIQGGYHLKRESSDWSLQELETLFLLVANQCSHPMCVFIDGLDEIDRSKPMEMTSLMRWLESVCALQHLKICVSSRPEPMFDNRLRRYPHLRVQDLTAKDIEQYVSSNLRNLELNFEGSSKDMQNLITTIVYRAEGVFLWAHLVVENIRMDTDYAPSWKTLIQRVEELPSGLHPMYKTMWERHNGDSDLHRAETASFLNHLLADYDPNKDTLLELMLRFNIDFQDMVLTGGKTVALDFLAEECSRFDVSMVAKCGGLVTTSGILPPKSLPASKEEIECLVKRLFNTPSSQASLIMSFGHRSAADFLLSTSTGHEILNYDRTSAVEHATLQTKARMCYCILTGVPMTYLAMIMVSPLLHGFQPPQLSSAAFDLITEACRRRPKWNEVTKASEHSKNTDLRDGIYTGWILTGFGPQLHESLRELPSEELYSLRKQLLISLCKFSEQELLINAVDCMVELLDCIRPQDLSYSSPFLLQGSLAFHLWVCAERLLYPCTNSAFFKTAVLSNGRRFIELLLKKCGGIKCLSKWRVLIMISGKLMWHFNADMPEHCGKYFLKWLRYVPSNRHIGRENALLVEVGMLNVFFAEGGALHQFLSDDLSQIERTCSQNLVMAVQFTLEPTRSPDWYCISSCDSKPLGNKEFEMDLGELFERLCKPKAKQEKLTFGSPIVTDTYELGESGLILEDIYAVFGSDGSFDQPIFNTEETLEFLTNSGYSLLDRLDPVDPLQSLLGDRGMPPEDPRFDDIDWSFTIDCERFEWASRAMIERERETGNLKAIAPCNGGTQFHKAMKEWVVELELLVYAKQLEDSDYDES
jgi:hypothetical protein